MNPELWLRYGLILAGEGILGHSERRRGGKHGLVVLKHGVS